jgi:hypothetical protein
MRRRAALALGLVYLALATTGGAAGVPAPVASKVERVLLYSDQARVFRAATVTVAGGAIEAGVADLPQNVLQDTVKVECKTAEVTRVEVTRAREHLPRQQRAKELIVKIEAVTDQLRALGDERSTLRAELDFVNALRVQTPPATKEGKGAPEGLFVDAWRKILTWVEGRSTKLSARLLAISVEEQKHRKVLHALQVEAQGINLGAAGEPVLRVFATVRGKAGKHRVTVSYMVSGVRWRPSYDLGYDYRSRAVEATYYALVSQQTGEDWSDAELRFSTGQPTNLIAVPELPTWTLGRQQDFTPQPRARVEPRPTTWVAPPPPAPRDPLASRLQEAIREARLGPAGRSEVDRDADGVADADDVMDKRNAKERPAKKPADHATTPAPSLVPPPVARPEPRAAEEVAEKQVSRRSRWAGSPPPPPAEAAATTSVRADRGPERQSLPWTDQGYSPPPVDPDSPAAGAQGYLFTLYAPGRHTVPASGQQRRVPIMRQRLSVTPIYRILPGLSLSAYLIGTVVNNTGKPILRGNANLFSGSMFSGSTWLNTSLPGKKIELPLGVDDSIKVVRQLRQRTVSQGVVFKDDVTEYTIEIQIANHRRQGISVEVEDQVPVKEGKRVELRGFSSATFAKPDEQGKVKWKGKIGASAVKKLSLVFQIVRPKDWELQQHDN